MNFRMIALNHDIMLTYSIPVLNRLLDKPVLFFCMSSFVLQGIVLDRNGSHLSKRGTGSARECCSLLIIAQVDLPSLGSLGVTWHGHFDVGSGWRGRWLKSGVGEVLGRLWVQVEQALGCWVVEHYAAAILLMGNRHIDTLFRLYIRVHGDHGASIVNTRPPVYQFYWIWSSFSCIFRSIDTLAGHLPAFDHLLHL